MSVNKFLIGGTVGLIATILVASVFFQSSPLLWFVDTSPVYLFLRSVMVLLMIGLLVTSPPRSKLLRSSLAIFAVMLVVVVVERVMAYQIHLLDVIIFIEVAIILAIESLERSTYETRSGSLLINKS